LKQSTRVRKKGRRYTDEQRAQVLAVLKANGGKIKPTSRETGVPAVTIRGWRDNPENAAPADVRSSAERDLAAEIDEVRWLYLDQARKSVRQERGSFAVSSFVKLTEAHQLLTGGPTQRIEGAWGELLTQIRDRRLRVIEGGKDKASA
jgi:transposase-like protein